MNLVTYFSKDYLIYHNKIKKCLCARVTLSAENMCNSKFFNYILVGKSGSTILALVLLVELCLSGGDTIGRSVSF